MWSVPSIESDLCWSSVTTTNQCLSMIPYLLLMPLILLQSRYFNVVLFFRCICRLHSENLCGATRVIMKKTPGSTNLAMFMVFNACEQKSNQIGVIKFSLTCPKQIHASWQVPKLYFIRCLAPLLVKQPCFSIWTGFLARFLEILSSNFDTVLDAQLCCQNRNFASFPWRYITLVIRKSWSSRLRFGSCREHLC